MTDTTNPQLRSAMAALGHRWILVAMLIASSSQPRQAHANDAVLSLLQNKHCPKCNLADADLVHADLREADLRGAQLMRTNLGQARLDGANLSGADLNFSSLRGASLRGADLRGSNLYGTDLREADLSGAQLSPNALEEAHWQGASGITHGTRSHAALHNAGVVAFQAGRWSEAEQLFSDAIRRHPHEPLSWVARGICRTEQAKDAFAAADFRYAAVLYQQRGNVEVVAQLQQAATSVQKRRTETVGKPHSNGWGGQILSGVASVTQALAPLAVKVLAPMGVGF